MNNMFRNNSFQNFIPGVGRNETDDCSSSNLNDYTWMNIPSNDYYHSLVPSNSLCCENCGGQHWSYECIQTESTQFEYASYPNTQHNTSFSTYEPNWNHYQPFEMNPSFAPQSTSEAYTASEEERLYTRLLELKEIIDQFGSSFNTNLVQPSNDNLNDYRNQEDHFRVDNFRAELPFDPDYNGNSEVRWGEQKEEYDFELDHPSTSETANSSNDMILYESLIAVSERLKIFEQSYLERLQNIQNGLDQLKLAIDTNSDSNEDNHGKIDYYNDDPVQFDLSDDFKDVEIEEPSIPSPPLDKDLQITSNEMISESDTRSEVIACDLDFDEVVSLNEIFDEYIEMEKQDWCAMDVPNEEQFVVDENVISSEILDDLQHIEDLNEIEPSTTPEDCDSFSVDLEPVPQYLDLEVLEKDDPLPVLDFIFPPKTLSISDYVSCLFQKHNITNASHNQISSAAFTFYFSFVISCYINAAEIRTMLRLLILFGSLNFQLLKGDEIPLILLLYE